ncbi:MAG: hypothetical protein AAFR41_01610 [Pseudomonadota bacterium]
MADPFKILVPEIAFDTGTVIFRYVVPGFGDFEERVVFPRPLPTGPAITRLANAAACVIGTSYFKLAPAAAIAIDMPLSPPLLALAEDTYTHGLGEFYVRNGLAFPPDISLTAPPGDDNGSHRDAQAPSGAIVAFGGGKDSHVAADLLARAGIDAEPVSVILAEKVGSRLSGMLDGDLTFIRRTIDPRLIALGRAGRGLNGHIPITAINSVLLTLFAAATGRAQVVFANERAASSPTIKLETGTEVNHQHSKSLGYEALLRAVFDAVPGLDVDYFSILRPTSELWTIRYLVDHCPGALRTFASCNRNFVFEGPSALAEDRNWCLTCSKCVYTAVLLATKMGPDRLKSVMGGNPFEIADNTLHLEKLSGILPVKPWECVGEIEEIAAALDRIYKTPAWAGLPVLDAVEPAFRRRWPNSAALEKRYDASFALAGENFIPAPLFSVMTAPEQSR